MTDRPAVRNAADLQKHAGQVARVRGRYRPDFQPAHKMLVEDTAGQITKAGCVAVLILEDGAIVDLFGRPEQEARLHEGREVVVTGNLRTPDGGGRDATVAQANPLYSMIQISSIVAAD